MPDEIRIEYMPLSKLVRAPRNAKTHDLQAIAESMQRFGYVASVIIDDATGRLVAGHGRLDTLQSLKAQGQPPPDRIRVNGDEWLVPVQCGVSFDDAQEAEAYVVADNRTTEMGGWDETMLAEVLSDLAAAEKLDGTGYDGDDLDAMLGVLGDTKPLDRSLQEIDMETLPERPTWVLCTMAPALYPKVAHLLDALAMQGVQIEVSASANP